jgi:hypothetical protein
MSKANGFFDSFSKAVLYLEGMNPIRGVHEEIEFFGKDCVAFFTVQKLDATNKASIYLSK